MVQAQLSVIIYTPRAHSMAHWALYLCITWENEIQHLIYQANGDERELELDIREADPKKSQRFSEQIIVSDLDDKDTIAEVQSVLEKQPMDNDVPTWNCQDWVMGALQQLEDASLLDEWQYAHVKDSITAKYHD